MYPLSLIISALLPEAAGFRTLHPADECCTCRKRLATLVWLVSVRKGHDEVTKVLLTKVWMTARPIATQKNLIGRGVMLIQIILSLPEFSSPVTIERTFYPPVGVTVESLFFNFLDSFFSLSCFSSSTSRPLIPLFQLRMERSVGSATVCVGTQEVGLKDGLQNLRF